MATSQRTNFNPRFIFRRSSISNKRRSSSSSSRSKWRRSRLSLPTLIRRSCQFEPSASPLAHLARKHAPRGLLVCHPSALVLSVTRKARKSLEPSAGRRWAQAKAVCPDIPQGRRTTALRRAPCASRESGRFRGASSADPPGEAGGGRARKKRKGTLGSTAKGLGRARSPKASCLKKASTTRQITRGPLSSPQAIESAILPLRAARSAPRTRRGPRFACKRRSPTSLSFPRLSP